MKRILLCALLAVLAVPGDAGACLTPVAPDGHEPPCNPFAGSAVWSVPHRGSYAQHSSPYAGPAPGEPVRVDTRLFGNEVPVIVQLSEPYADGKRALWFSTVGVPEARGVYKLDYDTLEVLGHYDGYEEGTPPERPTTSGVYNALLRGNRLVTARTDRLELYGDAQPGVRASDVALLKRIRLPDRARCSGTDRIIGFTVLFTGEVAFVTTQGMVGTIPGDPERFDEQHLRTLSLSCGREGVSNSISADEDGGIYIVSDHAMYRVDWRDGALRQRWRTPYKTGAGGGGARIDEGSGSTPALMGTDRGDDRFVVITDGQRLMHVVLFGRDDGKIACEHPVTFGDPNATASTSEQSVVVRGYGTLVVNNVLALDDVLGALPEDVRPASALTAPVPENAPTGVERIDWDARTRTCRSVWANREASIPNGIPTMSAATGLAYGAGLKGQTWGMLGLDWATGAERLWVPSGDGPQDNSFFAATTVGPDGSVLYGTSGQLIVYRGPRKPEPRMECRDLEAPVLRAVHAHAHGGRLTVRGRASDLACGAAASAPRVRVTVRRGRRVVLARTARGGARWTLRGRLRPGRYMVEIRAIDRTGNVTALTTRVRRAP